MLKERIKSIGNQYIIIDPLIAEDAEFLSRIYSDPRVIACYKEVPLSGFLSARAFTQHLIEVCDAIYTIKLKQSPDIPIGDCALHHHNKETAEIEIGGSLLPEYWGKGIMESAFELLTKIARTRFSAKYLVGKTETGNSKAVRLVEKMGFQKHPDENKEEQLIGTEIVFRKHIAANADGFGSNKKVQQ